MRKSFFGVGGLPSDGDDAAGCERGDCGQRLYH